MLELGRVRGEMLVTVKQPGLELYGLRSRKLLIPGKPHDVYASNLVVATPDHPVAVMTLNRFGFPFGVSAAVARDHADKFLTDNNNNPHHIGAEGFDNYTMYFGQRGSPQHVTFGLEDMVAVTWEGDRHREIIGALMDIKKARTQELPPFTDLPNDRVLVATSSLLRSHDYDQWAPLPGKDAKKVEIMLGATLHEDEDNTAFGKIFLARRSPGQAEPEVTWSHLIELASINKSTAENEQTLTNLARFIEFIKGLTNETVSDYGLTDVYDGPHDFIKQVGRYISNGDRGRYIMPESDETYLFELAMFPETLSETAVLAQKIRLERYLLTGKE